MAEPPPDGTSLLSYGNSSGRDANREQAPHQHKLREGRTALSPDQRWMTHAYFDDPNIPGDSGSPVLLGDGTAAGLIRYTAVSRTPPGAVGVTNIEPVVTYANEHTNLTVELKTWPVLQEGLLPTEEPGIPDDHNASEGRSRRPSGPAADGDPGRVAAGQCVAAQRPLTNIQIRGHSHHPLVRAGFVALLLLTSGFVGCIGVVDDGPQDLVTDDPPLTPIDRSVEGLSDSQPTQRVQLADGDSFELTAGYVQHDPGTGEPIRMMAYNGQIPGPELHVPEGAEVDITFTNQLDRPTTVHWHGLRLDNANDGVPNVTQAPVQPGETFEYTIEVPDAGVFWYHPHVRTDVQKELGLYGAIIVEPPKEDPELYPGESVLHLDDIRLEDGDVPEMYEEAVTYADSGRWGNEPFVNGTEAAEVAIGPGERHRLHLVNPTNARTWRLDFQGFAQVQKIGAGPSYLEQPREIDELRLGPAERATVDVKLDPGSPGRIVDTATAWTLARVVPSLTAADPAGLAAQQAPMGPHERATAEDRGAFLDAEPDERVHLRMVRNETVPANASASGDGHGDHAHSAPDPAKGEVNPKPTSRDMEWLLVDQDTGEAKPTYEFAVGDVVEFTIDVVHQHGEGGDHAAHAPVPHTIHLHGQRFLVADYGGQEPAERAWKDTVLANDPVRDYQSTTIQVEMDNPGTWLVHCHISEHSEAGMTALVNVS